MVCGLILQSKEEASWPPDGQKLFRMSPRWPQWANIAGRCPQDVPRWSQDGPICLQDGPKIVPRCFKMPQDASKMPPRRLQDTPRCPKMPPRCPQMPPRCPNMPPKAVKILKTMFLRGTVAVWPQALRSAAPCCLQRLPSVFKFYAINNNVPEGSPHTPHCPPPHRHPPHFLLYF